MVVIRVKHRPSAKLTVYGEFVPVSDRQVGMKVEEVVTHEKAKEICRDKTNPTKPWMEGEPIEMGDGWTRFAFNRDKKGWHYGWASNKHTCNANHALQAYVMEDLGEDKLIVKGVYQSPQFTLFCRRRRRFALVPLAPTAPPSDRQRQRIAQQKRTKENEEQSKDKSKQGNSKKRPPQTAENEPPNKTAMIDMDEEQDENARENKERRLRRIRIERILREIARSAATRTRQVVPVSRPCSPALSITDVASTTTSEELNMTRSRGGSNFSDYFDNFLGESLLEYIDIDMDDIAAYSEASVLTDRVRVIEELAAYLLEERGFSEAIYKLSKVKHTFANESDKNEAYDCFVLVISSYLNQFLEKKSMTLEDFDALFPLEPSCDLDHISRVVKQVTHSDDEDDEPKKDEEDKPLLTTDFIGLEKMNGSWILDKDDIGVIRETAGYNSVLRKALSFMEKQFHVTLKGFLLSVNLQSGLMSSGSMKIVLDGEEHSWGMRMPLLEGLVSIWKYRAWVTEGVIHHIHETSQGYNTRMRRKMWVSEDDFLNIDISLENFNNDVGKWEVVANALQRAKRCK